MLSIEYRNTQLRDLRVVTFRKTETSPETATGIEVNGEVLEPGTRFWTSLFHRFGLTGNIFRYFGYDEVLRRVVERNADDQLRLCVERTTTKSGATRGRLLAASNPRRPVLTYDQTHQLVARYGDEKPSYHNGVLSGCHVPKSGEYGFDIGPDRFNNRFVVEVPVDGFGQPRIYLSLLRQICSNGAIGYSRAFRSDIRIGEDAAYTLERALGQFDHDEGFAALRQRFESAQKSWASVHETLQLHKTIARMRTDGTLSTPGMLADLNKVAGDLHALYGVANLESLSVKRQRVLPAKCRVYDLINFASEVATHKAPTEAKNRLQGYIGTLISDEYDLEGTAEKVPQFTDLFLNLN